MLAIVPSATLLGVEGRPVSVEVHVSNGLPAFSVVGRDLGQDFQRDAALQLRVFRRIHHPHPAAAERLDNTVVTERAADHLEIDGQL